MTDQPDNIAAVYRPAPPRDPATLRTPAPIRVDREQLTEALRPVVDALRELNRVIREEVAPALQEAGRNMARAANAAEQGNRQRR